MIKRKNKILAFNLDNKRDIKILGYIENEGINFNSYVKTLIESDMNKKADKTDKQEIKKMISEVLNEMDLTKNNINTKNDIKNSTEKITSKQKISIKNICNNLKS